MDTKVKKTIEERAQDFYEAVFDDEMLELLAVADGRKPSKKLKDSYSYNDWKYPEETAREILEGQTYGMDKTIIYHITLAGGGPAARIEVEADEDGEVVSASLQFCDWFERWTDAPNQDSNLVEQYASLVGYYGQ